MKSYHNVSAHNYGALQNALVNGPVAVVVDGSTSAFHNYSSGILNTTSCGTSQS